MPAGQVSTRRARERGNDLEETRAGDLGMRGEVFVQLPDFVRVGARGAIAFSAIGIPRERRTVPTLGEEPR